ncbi:MAG: rod shape-determining protein MreC [Proteobacteria bacterium]|nr:rod shape-determining protein MreC [Pseudomonadota bacterium]
MGFKTVLLVMLSVVLMTIDRQAGHLDRVREGLGVLVYPVRFAVNVPHAGWDWFSMSLASRSELLEENEQLRAQLLELSFSQQQLAALRQENERLRKLLESSRRVEQSVQVASLLRADLDPFRHRVTLNRGSNSGVTAGMSILDADGVVGQVTLATFATAEAILITDPGHAIPVEVNRNGVRTVALGTGALDRLDLPFLSNSADIQEGDLLVTSGLGGRFPRGYPVAIVAGIDRDPGRAFASIVATPVAQLDRIHEVLLVNAPEHTWITTESEPPEVEANP